MLPNNFLKDPQELLAAVIGGLVATFFFTPMVLLFLFLSYGKEVGIMASVLTLAVSVFVLDGLLLAQLVLFSIVPAVVVGFSYVRYIPKEEKIWWYPESFVLRDMVGTFFVSLLLLSIMPHFEQIQAHTVEAIRLLTPASNAQPLMTIFNKALFGIFAFANMVNVVFSFFLAKFLSKCLKKGIRPDYDGCNVSISPLLGVFPLVSFAIIALFADAAQIFYGLAAISLMAPLLAGISLMHFFMNNRKNTKILLIIFYLLFFLMPIFTIFVMLLGIIDAFYAIRPFVKNQTTF
ncbi:MAG: hypothetical protein LBT70_01155 [Holosporaceae bacterium]|jgi:uncharacterized protein YybS (DUF2232 family)|nr:hypothetical protein [Holosporaceae bacterium]